MSIFFFICYSQSIQQSQTSDSPRKTFVFRKVQIIYCIIFATLYIFVIYLFEVYVFKFYAIFKGYFHLQLLQNVGSILCVLQYIFRPVLHPVFVPPTLPTPPLLHPTSNQLFVSVSVSLLHFYYICQFVVFFSFRILIFKIV